MSQIALVATPSAATANPEAGAQTPEPGERFDDRLRKAQPQAPGNGDSTPTTTGVDKRETGDGKANAAHPRDGDHDPAETDAQPVLAAAITLPMRQGAATTGKSVPTMAETPATATGISTLPTAATSSSAPAPAAGNRPGAGPNILTEAEGTDGPPRARDDIQAMVDALASAGEKPNGIDGAHPAPGDGFDSRIVHFAGAQPAPTPAPLPPPVQLAMQAAPGQPSFVPEMAQHVSWMVGNHIQRAEIQLNPTKLGPIQVAINAHHDRVDVSFAVQHPQTVHALQQTLPQLQHMLTQQGLNLGQASVGHQAPGQQHSAFAQPAGPGSQGFAEADDLAAPGPLSWRTAVPGRVDDFA